MHVLCMRTQEGMTVLRNVPVYMDKQLEIHRDLTTGERCDHR